MSHDTRMALSLAELDVIENALDSSRDGLVLDASLGSEESAEELRTLDALAARITKRRVAVSERYYASLAEAEQLRQELAEAGVTMPDWRPML